MSHVFLDDHSTHWSDFGAKQNTHHLGLQSLLLQLSNHCTLPSTMLGCSANFTYIPVKTTAQTLMLSVHLAANPEVQGSKHAGDIFCLSQTFFTDDHIWERWRHDCMGHAPNLHGGQVHVLVCKWSTWCVVVSSILY